MDMDTIVSNWLLDVDGDLGFPSTAKRVGSFATGQPTMTLNMLLLDYSIQSMQIYDLRVKLTLSY